MRLAAGQKIGPYEILGPIGAGGMGEVYRAHDPRIPRNVAIKVLREDFEGFPDRLQRLKLEARVVGGLKHPNVLTMFDVGTYRGAPFIVTELLEGETLHDRLARGRIPARNAAGYAAALAHGLGAAHAKGVVHRDLKPGNIFLNQGGGIKILDFGLAKVMSPPGAGDGSGTATLMTQPGAILGTVGYMSPEQVRGQEADPRSDIFSLGVVLYEMLAGRRPFSGDSRPEILAAILKHDPEDLPDTVPVMLNHLVRRCLEKEPDERFQSAKDLAFALEQVPVAAHSNQPQEPAPASLLMARRSLLILMAVVGIALGVAVGAWWYRGETGARWTGTILGGPEVAFGARPSPDGHTIAFTAWEHGTPQVGLLKPETANIAILTHGGEHGHVQNLCWSADGSRIYYDRVTDIPRGVFSVPALGGAEQLLIEDASSPEALPDGSLLIAMRNQEHRRQLVRFWPESGRQEPFEIELGGLEPLIRRSADGKMAVVLGQLKGAPNQKPHLYRVDLVSRKAVPLRTGLPDDSEILGYAIESTGKILIAAPSGNLVRIFAVGAQGSARPEDLFTVTAPLLSLDVGSDGAIYLDQFQRPAAVLRMDAAGGHAETIAAFPNSTILEDSLAVLPDGRAGVVLTIGGHLRAVAVEPRGDTVPLVNTSEETGPPLAPAGRDEALLLIGPRPQHTIAVVTVSNGRVVRRIPFDKGLYITSLAMGPDGVIYCASNGVVWAIGRSGEVRRVRAGDHIAVDPSGRALIVQMVESPVLRFFRVPLDGGPEREFGQASELRAAGFLMPDGMDKSGRILEPLSQMSRWNWLPGFIDEKGTFKAIPIDVDADYHALSWTRDGHILALALGTQATLWRFQRNGIEMVR